MLGFFPQDVFLFIISIAIVAVATGCLIVLVYLIKILSDIRHIAGTVRTETDLIAEDVEGVRDELKRGGILGTLIRVFRGTSRGRKVVKHHEKK